MRSAFLSVLALTTIGSVAGAGGSTSAFLPRSRAKVVSEKNQDHKSHHDALPILRGGAGPFKGEDVAKVATIISIINSGLISLAPAKTLEMYGLSKTPLTEYMTEWIGHLSTSQAITQWCLYFNGNSVSTAMGVGTLYLVVFSIKSLLNDMPQQFGFSSFGQYVFLAINAICGHALLYASQYPEQYSEIVAKAYPVWGLLNALSFCLAPEMMAKKWGVEDDPLVTYEMKQTGYVLATKAVYLLSLGLGVEPTTALGYGTVPALLGMVMTNFVTKEVETFGMDSSSQWAWLLLKVFYVISLCF